ncbi:MAG: ferric reductase-like transmembrane domain-containing protein, partial [Actinomycetota bacterium]
MRVLHNTMTRSAALVGSAPVRTALGRRRDWAIARPRLGAITGAAWIGPLLVVASTVAGWFAFADARGDGPVALGLFVGAASIVLMAWSFLLAIRIRVLEPLFGGLDRMYQVHRWAGSLAMLAMFLHVRIEPEIDGGILGASRSVADSAEGLAGVGEYLLYGLVAISLIRWFPYRWWRLTHKLLGIPFAFACWHFFTAEKPYANGSAWGWFFGTIMVTGLASYLHRVVWRDMIRRGRSYTVVGAERQGTTVELELAPKGRPIRHRAGQFAVLKVQQRGLSEPHPFTIASSPDSANLRFFIRDLGDWSAKLLDADLVGQTVLVEGPYGRFEPLAEPGHPTLWVAGGVGITPFLSAIDALPAAPVEQRPILVYCVGQRADATAIETLEAAEADGRIVLHVMASADGNRLTPD